MLDDKTMSLRNFRPLALRRTLVGIHQSQMLSNTASNCEVLSQRLLTREEGSTINHHKDTLQGNHVSYVFTKLLYAYILQWCVVVLLAVSISCFVQTFHVEHFTSIVKVGSFCCVKFRASTSNSLFNWLS